MLINIHHIGGRWGTVPPIEAWRAIYPLLNLTLYEPDSRSREQIDRLDLKKSRGFNSVSILPHCIGGVDGDTDFHLSFDRNTSTMLRFNTFFGDWNFFTPKFDRAVYVLGTAKKASQTVRVKCSTIDTLVRTHKISAPDLLSIDTEGASGDILDGASEALDQCLGIFIEGAAHPIHHGETALPQIISILSKHSFLLISTGAESRFSITRIPIGVFDKGVLASFEDMVFLKDPSTVSAPKSLLKLSLIAFFAGCPSIAHRCFEKLDAIGFDFEALKEGLKVIWDFYNVYSLIKNLMMPSIGDTYTEESYNIGGYVVRADEIPSEVIERQDNHRRLELARYEPILLQAKALFRERGGFYSTVYRKYQLTELADKSASSEVEQLNFLRKILTQMLRNTGGH